MNLKRSTKSGCKYKWIRKSEFVAKTQFLFRHYQQSQFSDISKLKEITPLFSGHHSKYILCSVLDLRVKIPHEFSCQFNSRSTLCNLQETLLISWLDVKPAATKKTFLESHENCTQLFKLNSRYSSACIFISSLRTSRLNYEFALCKMTVNLFQWESENCIKARRQLDSSYNKLYKA